MQTLEVAIGLVAYFLLMSMVASAIVDLIEAKVRKKGRNLLKAVRTACGGGESFTAALYAHPRVEILYEGETADTGLASEDRNTFKEFFLKWSSTKGLPAFIPNDTFARAFLETLTGCKVEELGDLKALFAEERRLWPNPHESKRPAADAVAAKSGPVRQLLKWARAKLGLGGEAAASAATAEPELVLFTEELNDAYRIMRPIVVEADGDVNRTLALLADHFEKVNERSKGWYKHWVTECLLVIGLIIAVGTNGDTVRIVGRLNADPALRESMLMLADSLEKQGVAPSQAGAVLAPEGKPADKDKPATPVVAQPVVNREQILKDLRTSEAISGGWSNDPVFDARESFWSWAFAWALKVLGLAATGAAISLGAPFWFHLLQELLKLRAAFAGRGGAEDKEEKGLTVDQAKQAVEKVEQAKSSPVKLAGCAEVKQAAEFARYSDWAYLIETEFRVKLPQKDGWSVKLISVTEAGGDTQVYALRKDGRLVVAFRGTEPKVPADAVTDFRIPLVVPGWLAKDSPVRVHSGFAQALEPVWTALEAEWSAAEGREAAQRVEFCGHSLGGALAVLAATRFLTKATENRARFGGVFTIGQPRVGNAAFAEWAGKLIGGRYARAVNNRDVVPRVPPSATPGTLGDYRHFGTVHYFDASGVLSIDPGWFYRFLDYTLPNEALEKAKGGNWVRELMEAGTDHNSADYAALYERNVC